MAFLTPDRTYTTDNGIVVNEKILPVSQRPNRKLNTEGNKPEWITIHNTQDIDEAPGTNDAEQYARATFNGNMGGVTVHFYIDESGCWQILPLDEIGYHAADGYSGTGNTKSLAIEVIMDGSGYVDDIEAEDRGAKLAAWLLWKYNLSIDRLTTHNHWYSKKYCPAYILPHWDKFKDKVKYYLDELEQGDAGETENTDGVIYRVQVGAFRSKANAEAYMEKLKADGYPAFIVKAEVDI